jgi:Sec-independent protein translocase protein TatA
MPVLPGAFSPAHLAVIAIVALLVLGPDKLPELARKAAQFHRDYKKFFATLEDHARGIVDDVVPDELRSWVPAHLKTPAHTPPDATDRGARTWPPSPE